MFHFLIIIIAVASGFLQSMSGFGYSVVSMTTLPLLVSPLSATTISGVVGNLQSLVLSWQNRKHICYKAVVIPLAVSILSGWLSISVISQRPSNEYKRMLGIFLIVIAIYLIFFNNRIRIKATVTSGIITGLISGIANGLFGMGGPPAVMYMMAATKTKEEYLSTIQFFFLVSGMTNTVARIVNGALTPEVLLLSLISILGMLFGGYWGVRLFRKLSQKQLNIFVYGFMIVMGLVIAIRG